MTYLCGQLMLICVVAVIAGVGSRKSVAFEQGLLTLEEYQIHKSSNKFKSWEEDNCVCEDASLCENVKVVHDKELFAFAGNLYNLSLYNWTHLTTLAWTANNFSQLTCQAHNHSVRVIARSPNDYPLTNNATHRQLWIESVYEQVISLNMDGITFDYEQPNALYSNQSLYYTILVNETTQYFHKHLPGSQISVCVPWNPCNQNNRNDEWIALSKVSDLLFIMYYDTQSQVFDRQCIASANSPIMSGYRGLTEYLALGIDPSKLVLGTPWYGYRYSCDMNEMESMTSKYCPIDMVNFRSANCSDAAGKEISYAKLMQMIDENLNITSIRFDDNTKSPYFNYVLNETSKQVYQLWFDDPQSLSFKCKMAKSQNIRGVGIFTIDEAYDADNPTHVMTNRARQMWTAFDHFFL